MNLRALRIFVGVMDDGTLTRAAQGMNLSQSAASRLLSLLEHEVGVALFVRERRSLVPTANAELLYEEAQRILAQVDGLRDLVSSDSSAPPLRIICQSRLLAGLVIPAVADFSKNHRDVSIKLETAPRRNLARRIHSGRHDIAVATLPIQNLHMDMVRLGTVPLSVLLPAGHTLARSGRLGLRDLADLPYIALDTSTVIRRKIDDALAGRSETLRPAHEASTGSAAYRMVAEGLGYTFTDRIALDPELRARTALVPWDRSVSVDVGVFTTPDTSQPVEAFRIALSRSFEQALGC